MRYMQSCLGAAYKNPIERLTTSPTSRTVMDGCNNKSMSGFLADDIDENTVSIRVIKISSKIFEPCFCKFFLKELSLSDGKFHKTH